MKYTALLFVFFVTTTILCQTNIDTIYTKKMGHYSFSFFGYSILELDNNSLLLSAAYNGGHSYCDLIPFLYKTDQNGNIIFESYNTFGQGKIIKTLDSNFVNIREKYNYQNCSGDTILVSKFDIDSNMIWSKKRYYGICNNQVSDIIQTNDSGYIVTGFFSITSCGWPFYNSFLLKLDENGIEEWVKYFGDNSTMEELVTVEQTEDNGYVLLSYSPYNTFNVLKTDSLGNIEWITPIIANSYIGRADLTILPNNEILVAGSLDSEIFLIKINMLGTVVNEYNYPYSVSGTNRMVHLTKYLEDIDSYLFVAGSKLFITNNQGDIIGSSQDFDDVFNFTTTFYDIIRTTNGELVAIGTSDGHIVLVKFSNPNVLSIPITSMTHDIVLYPNPTEDYVILESDDIDEEIEIEVINYLGQIVYKKNYDTNNQIKIPLIGPTGLYFVKINNLGSYKIIKK